ncbi:MAG: SulP family inorganic anion transporter [Hyphomicrobiales bacterium]
MDRLVPAAIAGLLAGLLVVSMSISFPALVFTGQLAPYLGFGIAMALFSSAILCAVMSFTSSYPPAAATAQAEPAVVMGVIGVSVTQALGNAATEAAFATLFAIIIVASLSLGLVFLVVGAWRFGNIIRYIPFPVIGGFMAYIGWLLFVGGLATMMGEPPRLAALAGYFHGDALARWLPGVLLASGLMLLQLRHRHYLNMPLVILVSVFAFWLVVWLTGLSPVTLRAAGYLLPAINGDLILVPSLQLLEPGLVDWAVVVTLAPQLVVIWLISMTALLLSASGLELASRSRIDLNNELRATGLANCLSGLGGGLPGFLSISASLLPYHLHTRSRLVGLVCAAICVAALVFGGPLFGYLPKFLFGLVLIYLAFDIAYGIMFTRWPELPPAERVILAVVTLSLIGFGFVEGIAVGIVAGLALFASSYGRIQAVHAAGTGATYASNVLRPSSQIQALEERSDAIDVIQLQGYLFFGKTHRLLEVISKRRTMARNVPLRFLILDFERVDGADSSAVFSFQRLMSEAETEGWCIILAGVPDDLARALAPAKAGYHQNISVRDLDHALEYAEEALLHDVTDTPEPEEGMNELQRAFPEEDMRNKLLSYGTRMQWGPGEHVIRQGECSDVMYFVESGRLTAQLETDDGKIIRLRTIISGTVVGEIGCYLGLPRTASIVADRDSSAFRITQSDLVRMETHDPNLAAMFHRFMVRVTAERLAHNTRLLEAHKGR